MVGDGERKGSELRYPSPSLVVQTVKNLPAMQETQIQSLVGKIPWRREWLPTPVFLPGEFHGQQSLMGYSPWGCKESDTTEQLTLHYNYVVGLVLFFVYEEYLQGRYRALKGAFLKCKWRNEEETSRIQEDF